LTRHPSDITSLYYPQQFILIYFSSRFYQFQFP